MPHVRYRMGPGGSLLWSRSPPDDIGRTKRKSQAHVCAGLCIVCTGSSAGEQIVSLVSSQRKLRWVRQTKITYLHAPNRSVLSLLKHRTKSFAHCT
jgi:hypothetical protein